MTEGERLAMASIAGSWSARRLAAEINAAIVRENPLGDLAERKIPPVLDAYKRKFEPGLFVGKKV